MPRSVDDIPTRYTAALADYLNGAGEVALERAYELGREMIADGRGVVELAGVHRAAVAQVLPDATQAADAVRFLAESLAPFEMTLRGFVELNKTLEQRVHERTRELEQALAMFHQSQKMETVGRLAGGVAHDFNNLLSVMLLNAELALQTLPDGDQLRGPIEEILNATGRATALTRQLLAFSRKQLLESVVLSPNEVVAGVEVMLRRLVGETVDLRTVLGTGVGFISADRGQIEQVLMNLVVNARDAMPAGGTISIETCRRGEDVVIAVVDSGTGIAPDLLDKIFEPFFTTKPAGRGTGLGLATCYGIVRQSGGMIEVQSELGRGSRFNVVLPSIHAQPAAVVASTDAPAPSARAATILVVEDDAALRRATTRVLEKGGHKVLAAASGAEALALTKAPDVVIDLVVSDVAMPSMGGRELVERLRFQRPRLRVLYTSGYTDDEVVRLGVLRNEVDFMQKPMRPQALLEKVREILERPDP